MRHLLEGEGSNYSNFLKYMLFQQLLANMIKAAKKIILLIGLGGKLLLHYHLCLSEFYRIFYFNIFTFHQLPVAVINGSKNF